MKGSRDKGQRDEKGEGIKELNDTVACMLRSYNSPDVVWVI